LVILPTHGKIVMNTEKYIVRLSEEERQSRKASSKNSKEHRTAWTAWRNNHAKESLWQLTTEDA